jgi:hypothetical protein
VYRQPTKEDLLCGNHSRNRWDVILVDGALAVRKREPPPVRDPLPFEIDEASVPAWKMANRHVLPVPDGLLVGFEGGEFRGGLWWFNPDGSSRARLTEDNVVGLARARGRILAIVGLAHGVINSGRVLQISKSGAVWQASPFAGLNAAPQAFVAEPDGALLVLTTDGLTRIDETGRSRQVRSLGYHSLYPASMIRLASGALYVGMRHFLVRLSPTDSGYWEEWFVPAECMRFRLADDDCICLP